MYRVSLQGILISVSTNWGAETQRKWSVG